MSTVETKYLVDVFEEVVSDVRLNYDTENNEEPYFEHGHPLEILRLLTEKDDNDNWKYKKYPLIALFQDFKEIKGDSTGIIMEVSPRLIIVEETKQEFDPGDRYDEVFKPILYPIYEQLLESMADSVFFDIGGKENIKHDKWDRLFWGKEGLQGPEGLIFNDYLDAIDITFRGLKVFRKQSCNGFS